MCKINPKQHRLKLSCMLCKYSMSAYLLYVYMAAVKYNSVEFQWKQLFLVVQVLFQFPATHQL